MARGRAGARGGGARGGGARGGGAALAGAGLLGLLLAGARGQDYGDYDYDYDYDEGFTPAPLTPVVVADPTEYVPLADRPGFGTIENPTTSDLLNAYAEDYFRNNFGFQRDKPKPLEQLISFLDRAIPPAEQTRTGLESVMSGLSTVQGSLRLIQQEYDQADKNARKGKLYERDGGKGGRGGRGGRSPEEERELCGACVDSDTTGQCLFWAQAGQCAANPIYMLRACAASCCAAGAKPACKLEPNPTLGTTREILPPASSPSERRGGQGDGRGQRAVRGRHEQRRGALRGVGGEGMPAEMVEELARLSAPAWIGERGLCLDLRSECPSWARQGLCMQRPAYMADFCPRACHLCQ